MCMYIIHAWWIQADLHTRGDERRTITAAEERYVRKDNKSLLYASMYVCVYIMYVRVMFRARISSSSCSSAILVHVLNACDPAARLSDRDLIPPKFINTIPRVNARWARRPKGWGIRKMKNRRRDRRFLYNIIYIYYINILLYIMYVRPVSVKD